MWNKKWQRRWFRRYEPHRMFFYIETIIVFLVELRAAFLGLECSDYLRNEWTEEDEAQRNALDVLLHRRSRQLLLKLGVAFHGLEGIDRVE